MVLSVCGIIAVLCWISHTHISSTASYHVSLFWGIAKSKKSKATWVNDISAFPWAPVITIDSEDCSFWRTAGLILGAAGVVAIMIPAHTGDDQHAASAADGRGQDARVRPGLAAVKCPGNGQRLIPLHGYAGQLGKVALVNNISAECQRNKLGGDWNGEREIDN